MSQLKLTLEGPRPGNPESTKSGLALRDVEDLDWDKYISQLGSAVFALFKHEYIKAEHYKKGPGERPDITIDQIKAALAKAIEAHLLLD